MTVAPAFFLVGVIFAIAFVVMAFIAGLGVSKLGKHYPSIKLRRPLLSVYLFVPVTVPALLSQSLVSRWVITMLLVKASRLL